MPRILCVVAAALLIGAGLAAPASAEYPLPGEPAVRPSRPEPGPHHAYVAILEGAGAYDGMTEDDLADVVRQARTYWTTEAGDQITEFPVTVRTFERAEIDDACSPDYGGGGALAAAEATYPDVDLTTGRNHLVVLVPDECRDGFGLDGWASRGVDLGDGGRVVIDAEVDDVEALLVRLLGVNVGLVGSSTLGGSYVERDCPPDQSSFCTGVTWLEDPYSPVGFFSGEIALGTAERSWLGLVDEDESPVVALAQDAPSVTEHYRIRPRDEDSGRRGVTAVDPETGRHYFVDYRAGTGRDADAPYLDPTPEQYTTFGAGVTITAMDGAPAPHLWPIETGVADDPYDHYHTYRGAALPGDTFTSTDGAVEISVDAIEPGEWADVTVHLVTEAVPMDTPHPPKLSFEGPGQGPPPDGVPDCQGFGDVSWGNDWPPGTTFDVQWYAGGRRVYPYANPRTELGRQCYRGKRLQVEMTARARGYRAVTAYSAPSAPVTRYYGGSASIWDAVGLPVRAEAGRPLEAFAEFDESPFTPDTPVGSLPAQLPAQSLQWRLDGEPVPGATGKRYVPDDADVGKVLTVRAVREDPRYDRTVFTSQGVTIEPSRFLRPRPAMSGTSRVGEVVRAEVTGWSPGTTFTYQWQRDGRDLPGARQPQYRLTADDLGTDVRVQVEGTLPGYAPAARTSPSVRVERGVLATSQPRIRGHARVGKRLVAEPGDWTAGTSFSYRWFCGRHVVRGATGASYVIRHRQLGRRIRVEVTGTEPGYGPETLTSAAVRVTRSRP